MDGTLYRAPLVKAAMIAELASSSARTLVTLRAFRVEHERLRRERLVAVGSSTSPFRIQLERTALRLGQRLEDVENVVEEWMHLRPSRWIRRFARRALLDEIRAFRAQGGRVALVSDYPVEKKLLALDARELFDEVVANGEPGGAPALKPDPAGLLLAAERLGVSAPSCLMIGDRQDVDGEAAARAAMAFRRVRF